MYSRLRAAAEDARATLISRIRQGILWVRASGAFTSRNSSVNAQCAAPHPFTTRPPPLSSGAAPDLHSASLRQRLALRLHPPRDLPARRRQPRVFPRDPDPIGAGRGGRLAALHARRGVRRVSIRSRIASFYDFTARFETPLSRAPGLYMRAEVSGELVLFIWARDPDRAGCRRDFPAFPAGGHASLRRL